MTPGPLILWSDWRRVGLSYQATIEYKNLHGFTGKITMSYGFFTYHLIRWIHGKQIGIRLISDRIERLKTELLFASSRQT